MENDKNTCLHRLLKVYVKYPIIIIINRSLCLYGPTIYEVYIYILHLSVMNFLGNYKMFILYSLKLPIRHAFKIECYNKIIKYIMWNGVIFL